VAVGRLTRILLLLLGPFAPIARADLIYFKNGGEVQAPAQVRGARLILDLPDCKVEFSRDDIRTLVPGFWPAAEWETRRRKAQGEGFKARSQAVWWAIENGLTSEVISEVRALHRLDPKHAPTARMAAVIDRLDQPCSDPDFVPFQKVLAIETKLARSAHVLLLHQHSEADVQERLATLERVITGYYLLMSALGVDLTIPRQRFLSAWFASQKDYKAFLHSQGADAFATTRGYYHPTWNAVVAYDARSTEQQRSARETLTSRREELGRLSTLVENAPQGSRVRVQLAKEPPRTVSRNDAKVLLARVEGEINRESMLLDLDRRAIDLGTAAHEMIHQLDKNSGMVLHHGAFPYWLQEGFAAQFEVIRGGRWAGISRAHDLRLPDWRRLQALPRLERLVRDAGFGHGYERELYAQAWALVYYLRTQHSQGFLTFIDLLRNPDNEGSSSALSGPERFVGAFRRAFGSDFDALERDWLSFMQSVQTPLEQNAPSPAPAAKPGRTGPRSKKS
jgi:hypothetical protein